MPRRNGQTFERFQAEVLTLYDPPMRRASTRRKMEKVLGEFAALCRRTEDLTPAAIARWLKAHPGRRPATVDAYLRSLRAACSYAVRAGTMKASPFGFRSPGQWVDWDVPELPPPVHPAAAIAAVLETADREALGGPWRAGRLRAVIYTAAFTGARRGEILALQTADLELERNVIVIRSNCRRKLKTRSSAAELPVPARLGEVLADWAPRCGSAWLFPAVRRQTPWLEGPRGRKAADEVKALGLRAGVPGLTFQSCRHTFASLAEGWGLGELVLQRLLRHTRIRTQRCYRHPLPEVLREAAARVRFA
jgi:integrase